MSGFLRCYLIAILLLSACGPSTRPSRRTGTPSATAAVDTSTAAPTARPSQTSTLVPPTPSGTGQPATLTGCPPADPLPTSGPAKVVILSDQQAWWWDEAQRIFQSYGLPDPTPNTSNERRIQVSADGRFAAYQRPADQPPADSRPNSGSGFPQRDKELWMLDRESGQLRRIAGLPPDETVQRYPESPEFNYEAHWVNDSHLLGYASHPEYSETATTEAYHLFDADTGRTWTLFPGGEVIDVAFRPDLRQAAALAVSGNWDNLQAELRLIELTSGKVEQRIPLAPKYGGRSQNLSYAPDNRRLAVMIKDGIAIVDVFTGQVQTVSLQYDCQGPGSGFCHLPDPEWAEDGQSLALWVETESGADIDPVTRYEVFWAADGQLQIQPGLTLTASWGRQLSPDERFLIYPVVESQPGAAAERSQMAFYLQDVQTGVMARYLEGRSFASAHWSPDSRRFLLVEQVNQAIGLYLGEVCARPVPLPLPKHARVWGLLWLDAERFLMLAGEPSGNSQEDALTLYRYDLDNPQPVKLGTLSGTPNQMFTTRP